MPSRKYKPEWWFLKPEQLCLIDQTSSRKDQPIWSEQGGLESIAICVLQHRQLCRVLVKPYTRVTTAVGDSELAIGASVTT